MNICDFDTFCTLPEGTLFSYYEPQLCRGLYRKGKTITNQNRAIDFYETSLVPECLNGGPPVLDGLPSRWAVFDHRQQFVVFDEADLQMLKSLINA